MADGSTHALDGAYGRLSWARKQLGDLSLEIGQWRDSYAEQLRAEFDTDTGRYTYEGPAVEIPEPIPAMVGTIVQSERTALDYLVYALAEFDAGSPQSGTQFPITDSPAAFTAEVVRKSRSRLQGFTKKHVAAIERLQPYDGRNELQWLRVFRELSNPDKHRHPHAFIAVVTPNFTSRGGAWTHMSIWEFHDAGQRWDIARGPQPLRAVTKAQPGAILQGVGQAPPHLTGKVDVNLGLALDVAFEQGPPVIETLEVLESSVRAILDAFQPEFK